MKNIMDVSKTQVKALQRFRKGKGRWGIYNGHLFIMNPEQSAIMYMRPLEFDVSRCWDNWEFSPWEPPLEPTNYDINLETGDIIDTIKGETVFIESKAITGNSLDFYLNPWKHAIFIEKADWSAIASGTLKLAAQTFEAFGIKRITCDNYPGFQYWSGQNHDMAVMIVTMGMH